MGETYTETEVREMMLRSREPDAKNAQAVANRARDALLWLARNAKGVSLVDWNEKSNAILAAINFLEARAERVARGGKIGGKVRAANLSPERRKEIAAMGGRAAARRLDNA